MQPTDIEIGDHVLLRKAEYPYNTLEVRITKIAGNRFQVHCWNPLNTDLFREWLPMSDYVYLGKVRTAPVKISKNTV
jgi:hypothetical protein